MQSYDAVVVGGGHNGLVAATLLARGGRSVLVLERGEEVGGAAVSSEVFPEFGARLSRYSYLVSLFPPALARSLGVRVELRRRRVASYPPAEPDARFQAIISTVAERVFGTLTEPLRSRQDMRRLIDDDTAWSALFETPLSEVLERTFDSDVVRGTVLTDGLIGTFAPADDPLLRQNRCFLYHVVGGPWDVPVGGMGAVSGALAAAARGAGAELVTVADVTSIATDGRTDEATCPDGRRYGTRHVLAGVAPHVLSRLLGEPAPDAPPEGAQPKINMLLRRLPRVTGASSEDAVTGAFHVNETYQQ